MTPTNNKLKVQDVEINIRVINEADYISFIKKLSNDTYISIESNKQLDK